VLSYELVKSHIYRLLKQERTDGVRFTTMIDLYGLPRDFPRYHSAEAIPDKYARVATLESAFRDDLQDARFFPYIQLHEFEAILFSDPNAFKGYYRRCDRQVEALSEVVRQSGGPELIDDGQQTAPSKRIIEQFPDYGTVKRTAGPIIAEAIGLDVIRSKCRHFHEWLTKLEELGSRP
jgi:hypothetical protein